MDIQTGEGLQLWGGLECTRNRVGDQFHDQFERCGHRDRIDDLGRIADLGIKVLRYPALWEWAVQGRDNRFKWTWIDERLQCLKNLNINPIVGFVHHGSGPRGVDLLSDDFHRGLEVFARAFAERFPWVTAYTPVNEPLTTARFSALYGHWFPHRQDGQSFALAMLNQCRGITLTMLAVREVNPGAQLIQTEDLGKTFASPALRYQADFENSRRWLTFDLLRGEVDKHHPMGEYFLWLGVPERQLLWFIDRPLPPDVIGMNYYVTSERYLDEHHARYPPYCQGGNGRHVYADVEAVRVRRSGLFGARALLMEGWKRYHSPLAITEAHLGCTREDQLRWLAEIWAEAERARKAGADVRAVTAWSLLGAYDWDSLVTRADFHYEPGAFDVRGPVPRSTAVSALIKELATNSKPSHPVLAGDGWWRRDERLIYRTRPTAKEAKAPTGDPILVIHDGDALGRSFKAWCAARGLACRTVRRSRGDFTSSEFLDRLLVKVKPWAVIYTRKSREEGSHRRKVDVNHRGHVIEPAMVAAACTMARVQVLAFSSSFVFGRGQNRPYCESDQPTPICSYGRIKVEVESAVLERAPSALVIRPGVYLDIQSQKGFLAKTLRALSKTIRCNFEAMTLSFTYLPEIVNTALDLLIDGNSGIWHVAGEGATTWHELAQEVAVRLQPGEANIFTDSRPVLNASTPPAYRVLTSEKGISLSPWQITVARYLDDSRSLAPTPSSF